MEGQYNKKAFFVKALLISGRGKLPEENRQKQKLRAASRAAGERNFECFFPRP
jgi:hypothetical protein